MTNQVSDEFLLEQAETWLMEIKGKLAMEPENRDIANSFIQASLAASQLVIARNSVEKVDYRQTEPSNVPPPSSLDDGGF